MFISGAKLEDVSDEFWGLRVCANDMAMNGNLYHSNHLIDKLSSRSRQRKNDAIEVAKFFFLRKLFLIL